jgi:hypothetical protein
LKTQRTTFGKSLSVLRSENSFPRRYGLRSLKTGLSLSVWELSCGPPRKTHERLLLYGVQFATWLARLEGSRLHDPPVHRDFTCLLESSFLEHPQRSAAQERTRDLLSSVIFGISLKVCVALVMRTTRFEQSSFNQYLCADPLVQASRTGNSQVSFRNVSSHHPITIEVVRHLSYRILHHQYPVVSILVECWNDQILQLVI